MKKLYLCLLIASFGLLTGCASTTDAVNLGNGQYSISSSNFWAWSGAGQQSDAAEAANAFCGKQGKVARITSMSSTDAQAYRNVASGQVTFTCEDPNQEELPVELAGGVYMLAGSSNGYQGIKARYDLVKAASKFCAKRGLRAQLVEGTRESGTNQTSRTGMTNTGNSAENVLQSTSADIMFRCVE